MVDILFANKDIRKIKVTEGYVWDTPNLLFSLFVYDIFKFIFIALSLSTPTPNGTFTPLFVYGAGIGRTFGMLLKIIEPYVGVTLCPYEGLFAVVGAASFFGACTKTISPTIMMLEMTR